jgi:hypothetical protein
VGRTASAVLAHGGLDSVYVSVSLFLFLFAIVWDGESESAGRESHRLCHVPLGGDGHLRSLCIGVGRRTN